MTAKNPKPVIPATSSAVPAQAGIQPRARDCNKSKSSWRFINYFFCFLTGALLVLGFAPFNIHIIGILAPLYLFWLWSRSTKGHFWQGFWFGLGLFGFGISWFYISISTFGNTNACVAALVTGLAVVILSFGTAINGWLNRKLFCRLAPIYKLALFYPTMWVLFEWLRSFIPFGGFPWLYVGYTQLHWPLGWYAPIGSVYLVSWLSLMTCGALLATILYRKKAVIQLLITIAIWIGGYGLSYVNWTKPVGKPIKVALMQGDIQQTMKWEPGHLQHILNIYTSMTQKHWQPIVVWPEAAIPAYPDEIPSYITSLNQAALKHHSAVIFGIPLLSKNHKHYYNGGMVKGYGSGKYLKRHLVPFGEYIPFSHVLGRFFQFMHIPMSSFSPGPYMQKLLQVQGFPVAMFICYESTYPQEVRNHIGNAAWLVFISDDSWFGHSIALWQHEQMDEMRALETGRYVLNDTDSGITAIINAKGQVVKQAKPFVQTTLVGYVQPMVGETPWDKL